MCDGRIQRGNAIFWAMRGTDSALSSSRVTRARREIEHGQSNGVNVKITCAVCKEAIKNIVSS